MITHFAELRLPTVSISGTKQVYHQRLGLPVADDLSDQISFSLTAFARLSFFLSDKPLAPVHFAIQVPYSRFYESADLVRRSGLLIAAWPDGREIDETPIRRNLYFRDGDGNLVELIAHSYVPEDVIPAHGPLERAVSAGNRVPGTERAPVSVMARNGARLPFQGSQRAVLLRHQRDGPRRDGRRKPPVDPDRHAGAEARHARGAGNARRRLFLPPLFPVWQGRRRESDGSFAGEGRLPPIRPAHIGLRRGHGPASESAAGRLNAKTANRKKKMKGKDRQGFGSSERSSARRSVKTFASKATESPHSRMAGSPIHGRRSGLGTMPRRPERRTGAVHSGGMTGCRVSAHAAERGSQAGGRRPSPRENFTDNKGSAAFNRRHFPHPELTNIGIPNLLGPAGWSAVPTRRFRRPLRRRPAARPADPPGIHRSRPPGCPSKSHPRAEVIYREM